MVGVWHFRALRQEALPSALAASREASATSFRAHARTKTVLAFPGAFGAL